ncbi:hypothetical protein GCM10023334_036420 [Nonomuraea thailandensis]
MAQVYPTERFGSGGGRERRGRDIAWRCPNAVQVFLMDQEESFVPVMAGRASSAAGGRCRPALTGVGVVP